MGILRLIRRDDTAKRTAAEAIREVRRGGHAERGGALQRLVGSFRDIGLDGKLSFSSATVVARRARRGRARRHPERAVRRIVGRHRRGVTSAGFLTGLGGIFTLPVLLPANVVEFSVQATRMAGAIAVIRGYDLEDEEVRTRVLTTLMGEESGDLLSSIGLGPLGGAAGRRLAKNLPPSAERAVAEAIGGRIVRQFSLRSVRLFGKAIPGLGGVLGALSDRRQLKRIATAARESFPPAD